MRVHVVTLAALVAATSAAATAGDGRYPAADGLRTIYHSVHRPPATPASHTVEETPPEADFSSPDRAFSDHDTAGPPGGLPELHVRFAPYGWLPEMYGEARINNVPAQVSVTSRDLINLIEHNVHFMFAGMAEAEYGPWTIMSEGLYMYGGFGASIRRFNFSGNFGFAIVDTAIAYRLDGQNASQLLPGQLAIEALGGGRYWLLDGSVSVAGPFGIGATRGGKHDWVDPFIGARATFQLSSRDRLRLRGDYGGFSWGDASQETWNIEAMYESKMSEYLTLMMGYRILEVDNQQGHGRDRFGFDVQMRGPVAMLAIDF